MSLSETISYASAGDFTYDDDVVASSGGAAGLLSQMPANSVLTATYTSSINLSAVAAGALTGTAANGAAIASTRLDLSGGVASKAVTYNTSGITGFPQQIRTIKFKYTPNFTGAAAVQNIVNILETAGSSNSQFLVYHSGTSIFLFVKDSGGSTIINAALATLSAVSGTTYEVMVVSNLTSGSNKVAINGTFGSTNTATGTMGACAFMSVGKSDEASNFFIEDLVIANTVETSSNYTAGYTLAETKYVLTNPSVLWDEGQLLDKVFTMSHSASISGSDQIKYVMVYDGVDTMKYWTGSAWADSDGTYSQANTIDDVNTNIATLNLSEGETFKPMALLHSADGSTTPTLTSVTFTYDFYPEDIAALDLCECYLRVADMIGEVPSAGSLKVYADEPFFVDGRLILNYKKSAAMNSSGVCELDVVVTEGETSPTVSLNFELEYTSDEGVPKKVKFDAISIPNQATLDLSTELELDSE